MKGEFNLHALNRIARRLFAIALSLFVSSLVLGQAPLEWKDSRSMHNISEYVGNWKPANPEVEFDPSAPFPIDSFVFEKRDRFSVPYRANPEWFTLEVVNTTNAPLNAAIELTNPIINKVDFYVQESDTFRWVKSGECYPYEARDLSTSFAAAKIRLEVGERSRIYFRVDNFGNIAPFRVQMGDYGAYFKSHESLQFGNALYYGAIILLVLVNVYLTVIVRDAVIWHYLLFVMSVGIFQFDRDGYFVQFWFSETRSFNQVFLSMVILLSLLFNLQFFGAYFDLKKNLPWLAKAIRWFAWVLIVLLPLCFVHGFNVYFLQYNQIVIFIVATTILGVSFYLSPQQGRKGYLYLIGYGIFYLGIMITIMLVQSWISSDFLRNYCLKFASALEIAIITFALVYNYQQERKIVNELALERLSKINILGEKARKELQRKVELGDELKETQMKVLRAQMNPHFIFNSLNAIQHRILHKDKFEASEFLAKFSRLMRQTLENSYHTKILVSKDLEALELYIQLEQLRYDGSFTYDIKVEERVIQQHLQIPALLIQPFVENALWHGIRHRNDADGVINIDISIKDEALCCCIEDNGVGRAYASEVNSNVRKEHNSKGMSLTASRIAMVNEVKTYAPKITDYTDENGKGTGTKVEFNLPLLQ